MSLRSIAPPELPQEVVGVARALETEGARTFLMGESLAQSVLGTKPDRWSLGTDAPVETITRVFARAVPTSRASESFLVPTAAGPADLLPFHDVPLEGQLRRRGLRRHAMAWSVTGGEWIDPFDGASDLRERRIRTVDSAEGRLARSPRTALTALRVHAMTGDDLDAELEAAFAALGSEELSRIPTPDRRREILAMIVGPHAGSAVASLMRSGLERALGVQAQPDTPTLLERAPGDPSLRLAIWLRGSRAGRFARTHRIPRPISEATLRLIAEHPIERTYNPRRRASLLRIARLPEAERERLFWIRESELEAAGEATSPIQTLREALAEHRIREAEARAKPPLALDGSGVMRTLGVGPGPWIGEALQFMTERVEEDPSCNDTERLAELLSIWWSERRRDDQGAAP